MGKSCEVNNCKDSVVVAFSKSRAAVERRLQCANDLQIMADVRCWIPALSIVLEAVTNVISSQSLNFCTTFVVAFQGIITIVRMWC